jgi:aspartate aminotransferase
MMTKLALDVFPLSERVARMQASSTLAAMQKAQAMRASGVDVVDLGAGEPDFDTPVHIKRAAEEAMRAGDTKYTATGGTRALHEAIINYYEREFGAHFRHAGSDGDGGRQAGDLQRRRLARERG